MPICFRKVTLDTNPESLCAPLADDASAETLAGIEIFRNLAPDAVASLSRCCTWRHYSPEQMILLRQDKTRDVFFVVVGEVSATHYSASGDEVRLSDCVTGDIFGDFAAIDGEPRAADFVAVTATLIARMPAILFCDLLRRHESVRSAMLCRLTRIARAELQLLLDLSTLNERGLERAGGCVEFV